jgi:hypothetical protein
MVHATDSLAGKCSDDGASRRARRGGPWLAALLVVGALLGRSEAAINVTGDWYVALGLPAAVLFTFVQAGDTLDASGFPGGIDSATGAFNVIMLPFFEEGGCGLVLEAVVALEGDTFTGTVYRIGPPPGCQSITCFCTGSPPR